jgi:hypothetical protein
MKEDNQPVFTAGEEQIMRQSFAATMLRAAAIIDGITQADVEEAQQLLFLSGCTVRDVAKIDRALVAASYLRACAAGMSENAKERIRLLRKAVL